MHSQCCSRGTRELIFNILVLAQFIFLIVIILQFFLRTTQDVFLGFFFFLLPAF